MEFYTTEGVIMYDGDDFPVVELEETPIDTLRLIGFTIQVLLAVVSSLCVFITAIRTKSVRSQLLGVMLINMAIGIFIRGMVAAKELETATRGVELDLGIVECHLYYLFNNLSGWLIELSFIIICIDVTFTIPSSVKTNLVSAVFVWLFSIIFTCIILYGFAYGPAVYEGYGGKICLLDTRGPYWLDQMINLIIYYIIPSAFVLVTLFRFCFTHRTSKSVVGKKLPYVLTVVIFLVTTWALQIGFYVFVFGLYFWLYMILEYSKIVISLIWIICIHDLRNNCLCRKGTDEEKAHLLK